MLAFFLGWPMQENQETPPLSPVETEVLRIRSLMERQQFNDALEALKALIVQVPKNRDALYMTAVCYRYQRLINDAMQTLDQLELYHPRFSRLYQERGHCQMVLRNAAAATDAYLRAVNLNPALPASWSALERLFQMQNRQADAKTAASHVAKLRELPQEIVVATGMYSDGELIPAEQIVRTFLQKNGDHLEGMRLLARIGIDLLVLDDAEILLEAVLQRAPNYHPARYDLVNVLIKRHKHEPALENARKLLEAEPGNINYRTIYATACVGLGRDAEALSIYEAILKAVPDAADVRLSLGHVLKTLGQEQDAIEAYRAATASRPQFGDAYWSLANLKTYAFTDEELQRMREQEALPSIQMLDRYHLAFALAKGLEDKGRFEESFGYYVIGNELKKEESRYRPEPVERNTRLQKTVCTAHFFKDRENYGHQSTSPIFVVGLPRSGSTLIEQILASHSLVEGTTELANIPRLVHELQGREVESDNPRYPAILSELTGAQFKDLGAQYLSDTASYRTSKPFFVDKMPNNFRHIGLIHLMLPNAKIIDARREPMACCFSNFKQLFAAGQDFTYSLEDIARYYRTYVELMEHWDSVLPGKILRVHHEDVVNDLESNVRRILEFCELPFEESCLSFHKTVRSVRTASSEQVRKPIFRDGLEQWRNFEPWLGPLKDQLEGLV